MRDTPLLEWHWGNKRSPINGLWSNEINRLFDQARDELGLSEAEVFRRAYPLDEQGRQEARTAQSDFFTQGVSTCPRGVIEFLQSTLQEHRYRAKHS